MRELTDSDKLKIITEIGRPINFESFAVDYDSGLVPEVLASKYNISRYEVDLIITGNVQSDNSEKYIDILIHNGYPNKSICDILRRPPQVVSNRRKALEMEIIPKRIPLSRLFPGVQDSIGKVTNTQANLKAIAEHNNVPVELVQYMARDSEFKQGLAVAKSVGITGLTTTIGTSLSGDKKKTAIVAGVAAGVTTAIVASTAAVANEKRRQQFKHTVKGADRHES